MNHESFWEVVFGNDRPVSVEIGPGRGEHLLAAARAQPHRNFFAIERSRRRVLEIERRIAAAGLSNARVLLADAACAITILPDACVSTYVIQFPDPWWKRRHRRRRLLTPAFVEQLARTLIPGGIIELVTDVPEYFEAARGILDAHPALERLPRLPHHFGEVTSFARKARARNAAIHASVHRRRA